MAKKTNSIIVNSGDLVPLRDEVYRAVNIDGDCRKRCCFFNKSTHTCNGLCTRYQNMENIAFEHVGDVTMYGPEDLKLTKMQEEIYK